MDDKDKGAFDNLFGGAASNKGDRKPGAFQASEALPADITTTGHACGPDCDHDHSLKYTPKHAHDGHAHTHSHTPINALEEFAERARRIAEGRLRSGEIGHAHELGEMIEILEHAAGQKEPGAQELLNLATGIKEHLTETLAHHGQDKGKIAQLKNTLTAFETAVATHVHAEKPYESILKDTKLLFKEQGIKVPHALIHPESMTRTEEFAAQVKSHIGGKGFVGKGMAVVGGTVGLGVVLHGAVNMKRGLFGYTNVETGERHGGSLSNIIVGAGEAAIGLLAIHRVLTGRWSPSRATHGKPHSHHNHDHHGHGHGHSH